MEPFNPLRPSTDCITQGVSHPPKIIWRKFVKLFRALPVPWIGSSFQNSEVPFWYFSSRTNVHFYIGNREQGRLWSLSGRKVAFKKLIFRHLATSWLFHNSKEKEMSSACKQFPMEHRAVRASNNYHFNIFVIKVECGLEMPLICILNTSNGKLCSLLFPNSHYPTYPSKRWQKFKINVVWIKSNFLMKRPNQKMHQNFFCLSKKIWILHWMW